MALIILNSGGGGGGGGGLANIPVTNADGSVNVPATSLKFNNSLVVANGNQAIITPNGSGGGSNTIIGIIDPTNTTQASAVGQLYYNSITLQTFICTAIVSGVPATYTWNLITGITINIVAPTNTTPGFIGQLYVYNNNSVFSYYICIGSANTTFRWNVLSSSSSLIVEKNETSIVSTTNTLNFTGTNITVQQDSVNLNQANISVTNSGGLGAFNSTFFTYTYSYTRRFGQFPLLFELTDVTLPVPTSWLWGVDGGTEGTDYIFTTGKGKTTQNPEITFNAPPVLQDGYTLTLQPSSTATPPVTYIPYSIQITPQQLPLTTGTYAFQVGINDPAQFGNIPYWQYSATDVIKFQADVPTYLKCSSLTVLVGTDQPNIPTFNITANDFNAGNLITSTLISPARFPASYQVNVQAYMFNSDGISTTRVQQFSNQFGYYVPAFYIVNQSLTAPTFDITANQVVQDNYQAGQFVPFGAGVILLDIQVVWVAFPQPFVTPPTGFITFQSDNTFGGVVISLSNTAVIQVINGISFSIFGFQIGYTGYATTFGSLYLDGFPQPPQEKQLLSNNKVIETPKQGLFQSIKRLFGAK